MKSVKDNFSAQAAGYASFRPHYPPEMIRYIVSFITNKDTALDLATGNGQVAAALAPYFNKVYATDSSAAQLQNAKTAPNIYYSVGRAEATGFADHSFDLVTVGQAVHWFGFDDFYAEVKRVLNPGGVLAILGYGLFTTNTEADRLLRYFYKDIVGPYWDAERRYIDENYETIPFPLKEIETETFANTFIWTFDQLVGYLNTWSAVQHYIKERGQNPVDLIKADLYAVWEVSNKQVNFPLLLRMGRFE